ncbi:MAG: type 1 glutamine amidotransferase domain-containing protein [Desulfovibrionales bacterium]
MAELDGKRVLMFVDDMYEDLELWYPRIRLKEEGAEVVVAGEDNQKVYQGKKGHPCKPDQSISDCKASDFDILVLAGGYAPDKLRRIPEVLEITRSMFESGKLVAMICHAGWIPASAGILKGRRCTTFFSIKDDMVNAGAEWVDEQAVVDGNLISSRNPDDLPAFCRAIINWER